MSISPHYPTNLTDEQWHILGGGIRIGEEALEQALRREIKEEAGIELDNIQVKIKQIGEMSHGTQTVIPSP